MAMNNMPNHPLIQSLGNIFVASFLPGIDPWVLFCSFIGALIFVVSSSETHIVARVIYLPAATLGGYIAASEISERLGISTQLSAFIGGAVIITIVLRIIKILQTSELSFLKRK